MPRRFGTLAAFQNGLGRLSNGDFSSEIETEMLKLEIDSLTHTLSRA